MSTIAAIRTSCPATAPVSGGAPAASASTPSATTTRATETTDSRRDESTATRRESSVHVRREGDETGAEQACPHEVPGGSRAQRPAAEDGDEPEGDRAERDAPEAAGEQQVELPPLDEEADAREDADEGRDDRDSGVEREPRVVQFVGGLQRVACGEKAVLDASRQTSTISPSSHDR